jgi:decaprenyl-phosphate phosphoribosyltransferase
MSVKEIIELARIRQWIKNVVVLLPVVFGMQMARAGAWSSALVAAFAFCFVSSFAYIMNDIKDAEGDRSHPDKKDRPIASGRIKVGSAAISAIVFLAAGILLGLSISLFLLYIVVLYVLLQAAYTYLFKEIVLIDVVCIALGFVLRTVAGAVAIKVAISPWLFICMFTLCLFVGFCKRYSELVTIGDTAAAGNHRNTLISYTPELLTHLITVSAGIAIIAFLLYSVNDRTVENFGTAYFVYTLPVVMYGVFRFAMLSMEGSYSDPTELILRDRPFQATIVVWILSVLVIINWGPAFRDWLGGLY